MSRRGRATGAAISLFSFQDIITSVTAIMILLVLILTLELISRSQQRGVAAEHQRAARELRVAVGDMEGRAAALRAEIATLQSAARRSAAFSAAETRDRERQADERARRVMAEVDLLQSRLRAAAAARRRDEALLVADRSEAPRESAEHVAAMNARATEMEEANRAERDRQRRVRAREDGAADAPTFVFNLPPGETLAPRLVEVSAAGIAVTAADDGTPRRFPRPDGNFERWLSGLDSRSEYVVIILRPSGLKFHDAVKQAIESAQLAWGLELVGESMPVALGKGT